MIILGWAALVFPGFNVTKEKKMLDFALAGALVAGGIVVVVIGARGLRR